MTTILEQKTNILKASILATCGAIFISLMALLAKLASATSTSITIAFSGMLYQELLIRSLAHAPARIPTSLMYLSVVFISIFGLLIWNHIPDYLSWLGIILVSLSNILIITLKHK